MREKIEAAFDDRTLLEDEVQRRRLRRDSGAGPGRAQGGTGEGGEWRSNAWVMKAISLYFVVARMEIAVGPFEYHDKIPTKKNLAEAGVRVVPPALSATERSSSRA